MNWLDATLPSPAENLALDEALLDAAEQSVIKESLRFWESPVHFIVLGYANKVSTEVNRATCEQLGIPILRRCSGGGTVLQGPGVLNYSLVMSASTTGPLNSITSANQFIMQRNAGALSAQIGQLVEVLGHTDLAINGLKFSGNAQRRKRTHLLFHGTLLLNLDLDLLDQVLPMPSLQPDYRNGRAHRDFLCQLNMSPALVKATFRDSWQAEDALELGAHWPDWRASVQRLVDDKYSKPDWNFRV